MICNNCGAPLSEIAEWHGLKVTSEPWEAFWRGEKLPRLRPIALRFLHKLVQRKRASYDNLMDLVSEDTNQEAARFHVLYLRRSLAGLPFKIRNIYGWGYELVYTGGGDGA